MIFQRVHKVLAKMSAAAEKCRKELREIMKAPGNKHCADCGAFPATWTSCNLGVGKSETSIICKLDAVKIYSKLTVFILSVHVYLGIYLCHVLWHSSRIRCSCIICKKCYLRPLE